MIGRYATTYSIGGNRYGSGVYATSSAHALAICVRRGIGETLDVDMHGRQKFADRELLPSEHLRHLIIQCRGTMTGADPMEIASWLAIMPRLMHDVMHALTWLGRLSTASGVSSAEAAFADDGWIHDTLHWINPQSWGQCDDDDLWDAVVERVARVERRVPGLVPRFRAAIPFSRKWSPQRWFRIQYQDGVAVRVPMSRRFGYSWRRIAEMLRRCSWC